MNLREEAIRNPDTWQGALGLLPVFMYAPPLADGRYVLLNGLTGNFCLSFSLEEAQIARRAGSAWSCNVGHYITLLDNFVEVVRWDDSSKLERYTISSVAQNLPAFHAYLENSAPSNSPSIVAHYSRAFRRLRSTTPEATGPDALGAFLYLVACASAGQTTLNDSQLRVWDLPVSSKSIADNLRPFDREALLASISGMGSSTFLQPDLGLVIRHASGAVFEDAHRIATVSPQLVLDGFLGEAMLGSKETSVGINFTPSSIARTLAEEAVSNLDLTKKELTVLDPACGSGELLKEIVRVLEKQQYQGRVRLVGYDISEIATTMARFTLGFESHFRSLNSIEYKIHTADALSADWPQCDVLVMNPPFRRWNDLTPEQHFTVTGVLGLHGTRANYAQAFIHKSATSVSPDGVLASVAPNALFETVAAKPTRAVLAEKFAPRLVARMGSQALFKGSIVDAGLYVGKATPLRSEPAIALWADQKSSSIAAALRALRKTHITRDRVVCGTGYSLYPDDNVGSTSGPWSARDLRAVQHWRVAADNSKLIRAANIFDIRQGARMGSDVFVVEKRYITELSPVERSFFRPAVLNNSIVGGKLTDQFYVFYPHSPNLPTLDSEADLLKHVGTYATHYLLPNKSKLEKRAFKVPNPKWWEMVWPRNWQHEPRPKLVSKYFGGSGSFAYDYAGDFVVIVGHAWLLKEQFQLRPDLKQLFPIVAGVYLNLPDTELLIDYLSVRVGGGQLDLSNKYLASLLIPNPRKLDEPTLSRVAELAERDLMQAEAADLLRHSIRS